ncbi:hypothetical protein [Candidatus Tisiphia endosymbiont of Hybos culiciformis]|uniref:hypothetical protein n=1 Tax=Candidatus Tisiphia endosymbiont of Hybos culiciformis TaxID=3139331 RepID=UPI003CCB02A5
MVNVIARKSVDRRSNPVLCHPCVSRDLDSRVGGNNNLQLLRRLTPPRNDAGYFFTTFKLP